MKNRNAKSVILSFFRENIGPYLLFIGIFAILAYGLQNMKFANQQEQLRIVEDSIMRCVISCYAIEGRYPESLGYLQEHYGLQVDLRKYAVQYNIFASNIMPEVTVLEVMP